MCSKAGQEEGTIKKILVVAPSWVGDTVLAQPLFRLLRQKHKNLVLDVLAPPWTALLLSRMKEVDSVIENPFRHGELKIGARFRLGRLLREKKYDQAIILPNSLKSALVPFFASIPVKTGFVGEMRRGIVNDARILDKARYPLMVERFCLLAEEAGHPLRRPIENPKLEASDARNLLKRLGLSPRKPVAVFCPGAEYGPAKRWPYYAELANALSGKYEIWLLGSPKDIEVGEEIREKSGNSCLNLCGKSSLDEVIDLISQASLVISNDSGLMHVAAALDKPMVALYGSSSPGFTPPLSDKAIVMTLNAPCSPCFKRECPLGHFNCMNRLSPEMVLSRIDAL